MSIEETTGFGLFATGKASLELGHVLASIALDPREVFGESAHA